MTYDPIELRGEVPFFRVMIDEDFIEDCVLRDDHIALVEAKDATIARLTAELEAAQPVAVTVKPLVWIAIDGDPDGIVAGEYLIYHEYHGYQVYYGNVVLGAEHKSRAAAEQFAWQHHEARTLAAIESTPPAAPTAQDAARYRWLRSRNLDAIHAGGVFAGMTPENVVLNGIDLDTAIDRAMAAIQKGASHG